MERSKKFWPYYRRIVLVCLLFLLLLTLLQAAVFFSFNMGQYRSYISDLSAKVVLDADDSLNDYFARLDQQLDDVYGYPEVLANLRSEADARSESPARDLVAQTEYFRPLKGIYLYSESYDLRSVYRRTIRLLPKVDPLSEPCEATSMVTSFVETSPERSAVLCCRDRDGTPFVRFIKRVYQNMGRTQVGFLMVDLEIAGLVDIAGKAACAEDQYLWIETLQGICTLTVGLPDYALDILPCDPHAEAREAFGRWGHVSAAARSQYGFSTRIYTDQSQILGNLRTILIVLGESLMITSALFLCFGAALSFRVKKRINAITDALRRITRGERDLRLPVTGNDEISALCERFNAMMEQLHARSEAEARAQKALSDARYRALEAQVNPHFLFNTMENIGAIAAAQGCELVDEMCSALSMMMRYSIQADGADKTVSLREEMRYVDQYMFIIGVRMRGEIHMDADLSPDMLDTPLPRLSVQPLVENAIRHGLRAKRGEKRILVSARRVGDACQVCVEDNGVGRDAERINRIIRGEEVGSGGHTSIGIRNIAERLALLFGDAHTLRAEALDEGIRMTLTVPFVRKGDARDGADAVDR